MQEPYLNPASDKKKPAVCRYKAGLLGVIQHRLYIPRILCGTGRVLELPPPGLDLTVEGFGWVLPPLCNSYIILIFGIRLTPLV